MPDNKHENYEILNLIGYGLAKFSMDFVNQFGFATKSAFYKYLIGLGIGKTESVFKMRQDLLDPFFDNGRVGFASRGNTYKHRKDIIESLTGENIDVKNYSDIVKLYLKNNFKLESFKTRDASPIINSIYKNLNLTGQEAEAYFKENYRRIETFNNGMLKDARLLGDGYDFEIQIESNYFLAEVKGIRSTYGAFRMTEKEFARANEYKNDYGLIIISNLENVPKMTAVFNPLENIPLEKQERTQQQISYHSKSLNW